jgi:hypothetical protein
MDWDHRGLSMWDYRDLPTLGNQDWEKEKQRRRAKYYGVFAVYAAYAASRPRV